MPLLHGQYIQTGTHSGLTREKNPQILTKIEPFRNISPFRTMRAVIGGKRPPWPETWDFQPTRTLLSLIEQSWSQEPTHRPSMAEILARLTALGVSGCFVSSEDE
jgi:hypothetical protein